MSGLDLNDQQVLDVLKHLYKEMQMEEHLQLLDLDHLDSFKRKEIKPLYPHKYVNQQGQKKIIKFQCEELCCNLSSGSTCCGCFCNIKPPDQVYRQFGLGTNIYFNFMKHFSLCFLVLGLISVISIGLCYYITMSNGIDPLSNYQVFFYATTMGAFSSSNANCRYQMPNMLSNYVFTLNCPVGEILQVGPVLTSQSQQSVQNCIGERTKYVTHNSSYTIDPTSYTLSREPSCNSQSCKITLNFSPSLASSQIIAYPYLCVNTSYLFGNKYIPRRILTYIFVGIDILLTILLMGFICCQKEGEDKQIDFFKNYQLNLNDFTIKVKGFNYQTFDKEFQQFVFTLRKDIDDLDQRIVQIKIPDNQNYIEQQQLRKEKYKKIFNFMALNFFDNMINLDQYHLAQQLIDNVFNTIEDYNAFKAQFIQLLNSYKISKKKIERPNKKMSIFMVMNSSSDILSLKNARKKSCFDQYIKTPAGKKYHFDQAPVPDMLQWQNKTKWSCLRITISWIITVIIVGCSYLLFGFVQWKQNQLLSQYNFNMNCLILYPSQTFSSFSTSLYVANPSQYTNCYCKTNYFALNLTTQVKSKCSSWQVSYLFYVIIPILISVGLVVYNLLVSIIFRKLTKFQGHFIVTDQMFSFTLKRSFILIMNMGLIIVLLNFNYQGELHNIQSINFLFQGQFKDLTSDWYIKIGSIVVMTMIFNIMFPFMELFMNSLFKCLRKCIDKRCWTKKTSQKYKNDYISLHSDDVYPIEERYAFLISIFWVTLIFNAVIPLLNIIAALSFLLLQIIDKVLVFKFFKTPSNYDESLHRKFLKTLYIGIILHTVSSAFLLSEPNLIAQNSTFNYLASFNSNNVRVNTIIQTYYTIPYVILFGVLILYAFLKQTIIGLLGRCNKKLQRASLYKIRNSQSFFSSLTQHQLNRLKLMTQKQINRLKNSQGRDLASDQYIRTDHSSNHINVSGQNRNLQPKDTQMKIAEKTHKQIIRCLSQLQIKNFHEQKAHLIGMPGYQITLNQQQAQKQKKMLLLDFILQEVTLSRDR